ncbi:DUF1800 domain-containing protein [Tumidithrix elongata RA019]|uniref:DUF1800 domain-containing protein n=1 Tax=Tumidithrix elongata BACA0141 TaxID=2716417 RepID=A0AAW9PZM5_9CYAN|nr:DUF1800 domain-containing protein [Tumidithrix elongata RA019]
MEPMIQKAHFLRRASFGGTLDELHSDTRPDALLGHWLQQSPAIAVPSLGGVIKGKGRGKQVREFSRWLLTQLTSAPNPLHEKITNVWRDHFVVALRKVQFPQFLTDYEQRLRTYALGDFQELLWQVTTSPAMLSYLDNAQNQADKINENYSREVMELFTIGRGQYTEKDIQEGARSLTGWLIKPNRGAGTAEALFLPRRHDRGVKTFLGRTGNFKTEDVVEILANHPSTARAIGSKLWSTFAYNDPEPAIVDRLANVYTQNKRSIRAVVEAIFNSPEFYSPKAYRSHIKTPIYFIVGSLRQLQIKVDYDKLQGSLRAMGQSPYNAPSVKGWLGDSGWLTAPSLLTRLNLAQQLTKDYGDDGGFDFNPDRFSNSDLVTLLLDGQADPSLVSSFSGLSPREVTALLLSSPTYQLA